MNSRGLTSFPWLLLLSFTTYNISVQAADDEDFIPSFFSGRRNNGEHAGMDPPPSQIMATKHRGVLPNVKTFFMKQKLDHNNQSTPNISSWRQRYLVNDDYFNPNRSRPIIFIRVGGESTANETDLQYGRMVQLAKRHRALLLELEHRYYGESKPMRNLKTKNLALLSHRQALADLERFIHRLKLPYLRNGQRPRVILYGCSYAGSLAAFHRMVYPNSTAGSLSVCSPLNALPDNYYIIDAWNSGHGQQLRRGLLEQCKGGDIFHIQSFKKGQRFATEKLQSMGANSDVAKLCGFMKNDTFEDITDRFLNWLESTGHECLKHDAQTITSRNYRWNSTMSKAGTRQWLYQMCTEFGYFTGLPDLFDAVSIGLTIEVNANDDREINRICMDSFGIPDADNRNGGPSKNERDYFPELTKKASRTFFIHGEKDPWHRLGPVQLGFIPPLHKWEEGLFEKECRKRDVVVKEPLHSSHCEEPTGASTDYPDLVQAYDEANRKITEWIASA